VTAFSCRRTSSRSLTARSFSRPTCSMPACAPAMNARHISLARRRRGAADIIKKLGGGHSPGARASYREARGLFAVRVRPSMRRPAASWTRGQRVTELIEAEAVRADVGRADGTVDLRRSTMASWTRWSSQDCGLRGGFCRRSPNPTTPHCSTASTRLRASPRRTRRR